MIFHDVQQNTDAWQELRLGKATASNFACIMANGDKAFGEPAKKYALQLALERINGSKKEVTYSNEHMERGHQQEPVARMLYEEETFSSVGNGGFFDCGEYGDSPDGLVDMDGVIEIKSVIDSVHYATIKRNSFDPAYRWQLAGHLDCTGRKWVDFVSYCAEFPVGKQLYIFRVNRDDFSAELERLASRRVEFLSLVRSIYDEIMSL